MGVQVTFEDRYPGWSLLQQSIPKELYAPPERAWELLQGGWPYQLTPNFTVSKDVLLAFMDSMGAFRSADVVSEQNGLALGVLLFIEGGIQPELVQTMADICVVHWHRTNGRGFNAKEALKAVQRALEFSGHQLPPDTALDASLLGVGETFQGKRIPRTMFVSIMANEDLRLRVSKAPYIQKFREQLA